MNNADQTGDVPPDVTPPQDAAGPDAPRARGGTGDRQRFGWPTLLLTSLVAAVAGAVLVAALVVPRTTDTSGAEAGFARDMQIHHAQGVEMAMIVRDRTDDPVTRTLAYDIALTQQQQAGQMFAWLVDWELPQARSGQSMEWMSSSTGHDMNAMNGGPVGVMAMPGMASAAQMQALRDATGVAAEILFLQLMSAHHRGAIVMADAVIARSNTEKVTDFASTMRTAQQNEITQMQQMLSERGAA